ncbi:MAG: nitrogen fixation protein [Hyphomicrobiales bacterium]|nr:MAG: nitrogen fixation protein [Hyphomicrobiales bacterium]
MRIAVTSQNFRTVTGHAGKTRRFLLYEVGADGEPNETGRLDLPKDMTVHSASPDAPHPLDDCDCIVTGSCGEGFPRKMARRHISVYVTDLTDPAAAVRAAASGRTTH